MKKYSPCLRAGVGMLTYNPPIPFREQVYCVLENAFIRSYSDCGSARKLLRSYLGDLL